MSILNKSKSLFMCHPCGTKYGSLINSAATYHIGRCEVCNVKDVPCTESRDYGIIDINSLLKIALAKAAEKVISNFDFERVSIAMEATGWSWNKGPGTNLYIPNITNLKECARMLLDRVINDKMPSVTIGCGGFYAKKEDNSYLELRFVLAEFSSEINDN